MMFTTEVEVRLALGRMAREQDYIDERQEEFLKRDARELNLSQAESIRRGIDQLGLASSWSYSANR